MQKELSKTCSKGSFVPEKLDFQVVSKDRAPYMIQDVAKNTPR